MNDKEDLIGFTELEADENGNIEFPPTTLKNVRSLKEWREQIKKDSVEIKIQGTRRKKRSVGTKQVERDEK